jgi:hypothetical protein
MAVTHELAGIVISLLGLFIVALAGPIPRQVHRWHVHAIEQIEPEMITWLARAIGFVLFILGVVTLVNPA